MHLSRKTTFAISAAALLSTLGATGAIAKDISGPQVTAGEYRLKNTGFSGEGDDDSSKLSTSTELSYGLTGRISLKAEGDWSKAYSDRTRYDGTELKAQYELFEPGEAWINTAVEVGYAFAADPNRADVLSLELLLQKELLNFRHRANIEVKQEVGEFNEDGASWTLDWQSLYGLTRTVKAGFEYYGSFGEMDDFFGDATDNEHLLGPVISFDVPRVPVNMDIGYLFGLTDDSADHGLKWRVTVVF